MCPSSFTKMILQIAMGFLFFLVSDSRYTQQIPSTSTSINISDSNDPVSTTDIRNLYTKQFTKSLTCRRIGKVLFRPVQYFPTVESISAEVGIRNSTRTCRCHKGSVIHLFCSSRWTNADMKRLNKNTYLKMCANAQHELSYVVKTSAGKAPKRLCILLGRRNRRVTNRMLAGPERIPAAAVFTIEHFSTVRRRTARKAIATFRNSAYRPWKQMYSQTNLHSEWSHRPEVRKGFQCLLFSISKSDSSWRSFDIFP